MSRLIVEAVTNEKHDTKSGLLQICVSVSRADDGKPVTGLLAHNFRITNLGLPTENPPTAGGADYKVLVGERTWDPQDTEPSGVYDLVFSKDFGSFLVGSSFQSGETFAFGLQVREIRSGVPISFGQTVVSLTSLENVTNPLARPG